VAVPPCLPSPSGGVHAGTRADALWRALGANRRVEAADVPTDEDDQQMKHPPVAKFTCPSCGTLTISRVTDTSVYTRKRRPLTVTVTSASTRTATVSLSTIMRRQRECQTCRGTFSTIEVVEPRRPAPKHRPRS
jgi:hypothetical protein